MTDGTWSARIVWDQELAVRENLPPIIEYGATKDEAFEKANEAAGRVLDDLQKQQEAAP